MKVSTTLAFIFVNLCAAAVRKEPLIEQRLQDLEQQASQFVNWAKMGVSAQNIADLSNSSVSSAVADIRRMVNESATAVHLAMPLVKLDSNTIDDAKFYLERTLDVKSEAKRS